jgi:hypothetical protein
MLGYRCADPPSPVLRLGSTVERAPIPQHGYQGAVPGTSRRPPEHLPHLETERSFGLLVSVVVGDLVELFFMAADAAGDGFGCDR